MVQSTHKNLQSTFAAPPPRGKKLQGLLQSPERRRPASTNPEADEQVSPSSAARTAEPPSPTDTPSLNSTQSASLSPPAAKAPTAEAFAAASASTPPAAAANAPRPTPSEIGPTSVYLRTKAYRELVDRRQKKFRSYAQTVYDAFAFIRDKASDEHQKPADALAKLFDAGDATDPWLMPEPRSARNSSEPTVEAKIALKPQERQWVKDRMAEIGATHLSPFLATVLEHFLLHAKN